MKKVLLIFNILTTIAIFSASAADLNPFAYGLKSNTDNSMTLHIEFSINAKATSVVLEIFDVQTEQTVFSVPCQAYNEKHDYSFDVDLSGIPAQYRGGNKNLNWRVNVKGAQVSSMTFVNNDVKMWAPTSIDIDNNPENANFGTVFCLEGRDNAYKKDGYESYVSYYDAAGLYIINADGTKRRMPFVDTERYGYNGGVLGSLPRIQDYFDNTTNFPVFLTYRVRVSDDGRIFVTSCNMDGQILWEVNKDLFTAATKAEWQSMTGWKKVMATGVDNAVMATEKRNCSHTYCGIYSIFAGNASTGAFVAGPNVGFDVRGSGNNLQLLMLSGCKQAIAGYTPKHFYCSEYNLGEKTTWGAAPNRSFFKDHVIYFTDPQVQYDKEGNVWFCQYRGADNTTYPTLIRYDRDGSIGYPAQYTPHLRTGAFRFNEDFTKLAIATKGTGIGGGVTIYPVNADGMPDFTKGVEVSVRDKGSYTLTDFAWDYADNLYIACKNKEGDAGECIAVYATPRSADEVISTPAASKNAFDVPCQSGVFYNVTIYSDPEEGGTVLIQGNNARASVESFESCTELTLTAVPGNGYKFVDWRDGDDNILSTSSEYTHLVTDSITLYANFEYATYNVTWWNLFKDGEDIYDAEIDGSRNARLYYLFMAYYNAGSGGAVRWAAKMNDSSGEYNLVNSCYTYADELLNENSSAPMYWLGEYLKSVVKDGFTLYVAGDNDQVANTRWGQTMYAFINRVGYAKSPSSPYTKYTTPEGLMNAIKAFAPVSSGGEGKGEYTEWRPWWTNLSCDLPNSLKYNNAVPVTWTMQSAPYNTYDTYANNTVPGNYQPTKTPKWYQWNTAPKADQLLAWRDGSTTGNIVHHVSRANMELYATYVDKRLQENDPTPNLSEDPYDATNSDVLSLLANDNYGTTVHNVTIDRKFAGGMYNTVCFPFDLPVSKLPSELSGADIRVFNGVTETYTESGDPVVVLNFITLQEYWQGKDSYLGEPFMQAGMPYLIMPNADTQSEYLTYSLTQALFFDGTRAPLDTVTNGITFQGVFNPTTITEENAYILVADNRLAKVTGANREIKGYRGYFVINDIILSTLADEGRLFLSMKKPVTTSVPLAPEAEKPAQPKVRKVMYDGQIYILRGNEVYTITGNRVR